MIESDKNHKNEGGVCHVKPYFLKECKVNIEKNEEKEELKQNIINGIMNGEMKEILANIVNDKKNFIIQEDNEIYQISTLSNQSDKNYNLSIINFGECENILRRKFNLDESQKKRNQKKNYLMLKNYKKKIKII